jgi:tetratricopeptide (TPR) repeat protein
MTQRERRNCAVLPALIVLLVFLCFSPALRAGFVAWDDDLTFTDNPHYRGLSLTHLRWMVTTTHLGQYRPLTWLTYGIDYTLWGMNPAGYHLGNLLLHAANGVLAYLVIAMLLRLTADRPDANPLGVAAAAAAGALFFALHPLRVEAVAWATERQEVLCGFFFLLAVLAYLRMHEGPRDKGQGPQSKVQGPKSTVRGPRSTVQGSRSTVPGPGSRVQGPRSPVQSPSARWYLLSLACFALSLLSKPAGLMLPVVLLILDVYPLRRVPGGAGGFGRATRALLLEKVPYAMLSLAAVAAAVLAKQPQAMVPLAEHGFIARAVQSAYGLCFYLWKTLAPFALSPLYLLHRPLNPFEPRFILSALIAAAITGAVVVYRRRWPWALAAWAAYVVLAAPVLGLAQNGVQLAADRYTYVPCLPWAVLAAAGVLHLWRAADTHRLGRPAAAALVTLILLGLGVQTFRQTGVWHDTMTLWTHVLSIEPDNYVALNNRGPERAARGDADGALADYDLAVRLNPAHVEAYTNRGAARHAKGDLDGALADFNQALRLNPRDTNAYVNRGDVRHAQGDLDGALADYAAALRINPEHYKAYNNRGLVRQAQGDRAGALADFASALRCNPDYATAYNNRGNVLQATGDLDGALADFTRAIRLNPQDANTYFNRGNARKARGDLAGAIADYSEAIRLNPQYAGAYNNRGSARKMQGDLAGALADYSEALRLNPQHANAYNNRAIVRQAQGDLDAAVADYAQALQVAPPNAPYRGAFERNLAAARQALAAAQRR